jgi:hypothetical protein
MTHEWLVWIDRAVIIAAAALLWRSVYRRHPTIAKIVAAGLVVRIALTTTLFVISNYGVPVAPELQLGHGFWRQAIDAQGYYTAAQPGLSHGLGAIANTTPSPGYQRFLVIWLWALGNSPLVGALSNAAAYFFTACLLALSIRSVSTTLTIAFAAIAFSPSLIGHGSQILKDEIFANALVLLYSALAIAVRKIHERKVRAGEVVLLLSGFVAASLASGTRLYVVLLILPVIVVCFSVLVTANRLREFQRASALAACVGISIWLAMAASLGEVQNPAKLVLGPQWHDWSIRALLTAPTTSMNRARLGFDATGGNSSLATRDSREDDATSSPGSLAPQPGKAAPPPRAWLSDIARGTAVLFVPITVLRACCGVDLPVNQGLLAIADLDTVFSTVVTFLLLVVSFRAWRQGAFDWRAAFIPTVVSVALLLMLAYAVTNFGTLFRLRSMAFVPLWMLPVIAFPHLAHGDRG